MSSQIDLKQIERNVRRDYMRDGLVEILFGAYFSLIGLGLLAGSVAPFIVFPMILFPLLLQALKKRLVYPRTGYVSLREGDPGPTPWFILGSLAAGLVALVAVLIAVGAIAQPGRWYRWMPILFGIWMAGIFLGLGVRVGLARYYVLAGLALVGGPAATLLSLPGKLDHIGFFLVMWGAVVLVWGVAVLIRFVLKYPIQTEGFSNATG
jgi:hypothetical protein